MTLTETETLLEDLARRHPLLDEELLVTLLTASGWEKKSIQDAVALFRQNKEHLLFLAKESDQNIDKKELQNEVIASVDLSKEKEEMVFIVADGSEEKKLIGLAGSPVEERASPEIGRESITLSEIAVDTPSLESKENSAPIEENKEQTEDKVDQTKEKEIVGQFTVPQKEEASFPVKKRDEDVDLITGERVSVQEDLKEAPVTVEHNEESRPIGPTSLILHPGKEMEPRVGRESQIPEDLPLLPFESSPHVWSFGRYKQVFHRDTKEPKEPAEIPKIVTIDDTPAISMIKKETPPSIPLVAPQGLGATIGDDEEIVLEKTPLTKGDGSLVVLASVMLLAILLILGYMYSNGRL